MLCARDIITPNAIQVDAESRLGDIIPEIHNSQYTHAAVFDGERFFGVVPFHTAFLGNPQRIFADLVSRFSLPLLSYSTPIDEIGQILQDFSPDGVVITDENGIYEGIITKDALLSALLGETQNRLNEICRMKDNQEKFRLLGHMASSMSHDLNNILTAVLGNLELLKLDNFKNDNQKELVNSALTAAQDAVNVVARLQNYYLPAKTRSGIDVVDLSKIVSEVTQFTRPKWNNDINRNGRKIDLIHELLPTPFVLGNAGEIREVLTNLILNAVDAIPVNGIIRVKVYTSNNFAVVEVTDNGSGMNEEQLKHCFDPFYSTKLNENGTGLGLSICRDIIKEHCGFIELTSTPGASTTFRIFFPAIETVTQKIPAV